MLYRWAGASGSRAAGWWAGTGRTGDGAGVDARDAGDRPTDDCPAGVDVGAVGDTGASGGWDWACGVEGGEPEATGSTRCAESAALASVSVGNAGADPDGDSVGRLPRLSACREAAATWLTGNICMGLVFKLKLLRSG